MRSLLVAVVLWYSTLPLIAQSDRGTITGTVSDPGGAVIPAAKVTAVNSDTGATYDTVTTQTGNYTIPQLPAGIYALTFKAPGFGDFTQQGVRVQVAQTERIDVTVRVAAGAESVTVNADAPLMKTESAEQSHNLTTERILELPLYQAAGAGNGVRYPYAFLNIEPGATLLPSGGNTDVRVNGIPNDSFGVRIEGQESTNTQQPNANHINPAVEAMQEVTLQTSNFSPEYGQVGGGLINLTAKSGTNHAHGSLFEYWQNPVLNAAQPFINVTPANRANDYGGSIGGPVWIPKVYNGHNKTFFFFNLEQARNTVSSAGFNTVPTTAMRQGNFSQILTGKTLATDPLGNPIKENTVYDPATASAYNGQTVENPFPGNVIPYSRLDPVALKIQNLIPSPNNGAGLTNNWVQSYTYPSRQTLYTIKADHNIGDKQHISGYYSHKGASGENGPDGLPVPVTATRNGHNFNPTVRLNYDYTITPTLLFHFGAGWIRNLNPDVAFNGVLDYNAPTSLGLNGGVPVDFIGGVTATGFPRLTGLSNSYGGVLSLGPVNANFYNSQKPTAVTSMTWVRNNHTYKAGAEWRKDAHTDNNVRGSQGIFNFSNIETALPSTNGQNLNGGVVGYPYASFLLGLVDSASVETPQDPQFRKTSYALYIQDNFKVTHTLTIDYGLRWDYQGALSELHNRFSEFSPTTPNPSAGGLPGAIIYDGYGPGRCDCSFAHNYPYAIQPRLGLAWTFLPRTVLRAGWGLTYGQTANYNYITNTPIVGFSDFNQLSFVAPSYGIPAATLSAGLPYTQAQLFPSTLNPGARPSPNQINSPSYFIDPNGGRPPRVNQWSIGIQREITTNLLVEANYVGNRGAWLQANSMEDLNGNTIARLAADGLNVTSSTDRAVLTSTFLSGVPQAHGFQLPYSGFPLGQTLAQALRPFPQYGTIPVLWAPLGDSWYDSLQSKVTKRFSHGLALQSSFTWQKELELGTDNQNSGSGAAINNAYNRAVQKEISPSSLPFVFVTAFTYQSPGIGANRLVRTVSRDWTFGAILRYQSGFPIQVPCSNNGLNSVLLRNSSCVTFEDRVAGQPLFTQNLNCGCFDPNKTFVLNPAAWSDPPAGTWGTAAAYYNDYRAARRPSEQINFGRSFRVHEQMKFTVTAIFFNVFNRVYLNVPSSTNAQATPVSNAATGQTISGFGYINTGTTLQTPRTGVLQARFEF
jgi:hypothetical protein